MHGVFVVINPHFTPQRYASRCCNSDSFDWWFVVCTDSFCVGAAACFAGAVCGYDGGDDVGGHLLLFFSITWGSWLYSAIAHDDQSDSPRDFNFATNSSATFRSWSRSASACSFL